MQRSTCIFFTKLIEVKKEKRKQTDILNETLIREFNSVVEDVLQTFLKEEGLALLTALNQKIDVLSSFFVRHKERLIRYAPTMNRVRNTWQEMVDTLHHVQDFEDGVIRGTSSSQLSVLSKQLFDDLVDVSQKCNKELFERGQYSR